MSRVEVLNFRNFRHLVIDPFPARGVIIGENGVGKSNLLAAIRLVLDPSLPDSKRMLRAEDICHDSGEAYRQGVEVKVIIDISGFDDDLVSRAVLDGCIISTAPYRARLTYYFRPDTIIDSSDGEAVERDLTVDDYDFSIFGGVNEDSDAKGVRRLVSLAVLPALRDAANDLGNVQRSPLTELIEHLPPDPDTLQHVASQIDAATAQLRSDPNLNELDRRIRSQIERLAGPQLDICPTLGLNPSQAEQLLRSLRLYVDQERKKGVGETSTGNANVVYLALLLERLTVRRDAERNVGTILAVEEPEAHLHPSLQRHLFSYLLRHGPNLLLTTHSPNIAAVAPLDSLILLYKENAKGTTARTAIGAGITESEASDLERYLDVTRADSLFARFVIFVEGIAELYLIPAISRLIGFDLDAWGVVVTSVESTDFTPYRKMMGPESFDTPSVIVTDGDSRKGAGYLGLARAVRLLPPGVGGKFKEDVVSLRDSRSAEEEERLLESAWSHGVHVGLDTLEIDLIPLLGEEIKAAFNELSRSATSRASFNEAVDRLAGPNRSADDAETVLVKIDNFGKGRFAQRLAGHVKAIDPGGFLGRYRALYPAGIDERSPRSDLYVMSALSAASRSVRGVGLLG